MKIVKFEFEGGTGAGIVEGDDVRLVGFERHKPAETASFTPHRCTPDELEQMARSCGRTLALSQVRLAAPCDPLRKILCVGMNYRDHTSEIAVEPPDYPVLFIRSFDSLVAHNQPVVRPLASSTFDFEGEIAVVLGRGGRHIKAVDALDHVFGYSCFLDGSVRQYQKHSLTAGKNFWRSGAMGPWIVTRDEVDGLDLRLTTRVNGRQVQEARASEMIFGIAEIIAYCSRFALLQPGDVIATGTPGGVGARRQPPLWLNDGDAVEVSVEGVGRLFNPVTDERLERDRPAEASS